MRKYQWLLGGIWGIVFCLPQSGWAATGAPDSTLTIDPSASAGTTITAADENNRNSDTTTWANAHVHALSNTTNFGDGAAGNKSLCADAADATDRCLRWDDTADVWTMDQATASSFNAVVTHTGTTALTSNAFLVGSGVGLLDDVAMTAASTLPATFGDFAVRAFNSAAISLTSGTATILTYNSERWDTDTMHSTASNTGRLTATTAGRYQITGHVEFASTANTGQRLLEVLLNGSTVLAAQTCGQTPDDAARAIACSITTHYNLAATDYVELRATQRASSTLNVNAATNYSPEFEMVKVP